MMKEKKRYWKKGRWEKNKICFIIILALISLLCFLLWNIFWKSQCSANHIYYENIESIVELKAFDVPTESNYGTAVFIDDTGILVTNSHVVLHKKGGNLKEYNKLQIRLSMEDYYRDVSLIKYNEDLDIAVLQLNDVNFDIKAINIGNSKKTDYGDKVFSIGNTMNYGISISEGIISTPLIEIEYEGIHREVIQSDINISSGNSGGALLNKKGQLIGITSFRLKDKSQNIVYGIAFSVPIDKVLKYIKESD